MAIVVVVEVVVVVVVIVVVVVAAAAAVIVEVVSLHADSRSSLGSVIAIAGGSSAQLNSGYLKMSFPEGKKVQKSLQAKVCG